MIIFEETEKLNIHEERLPNMIRKMTLGERIANARIDKRLSLCDFASRCGVPAIALGMYEAGHHIPSVKHLSQIMDYLNLDTVSRNRWMALREEELPATKERRRKNLYLRKIMRGQAKKK